MWVKRNLARNIKESIELRTGKSFEEIDGCVYQPTIDFLENAVNLTLNCIEQGLPIYIFGDYDADGICSSAILTLCFKQFGIVPYVRLPKRFTEGYGMSVQAVSEFSERGLIICVDNGISANDAIEFAKINGHYVIVLDHHIGNINNLPCADVIVDAHVFNSENTFDGWCGTGLAWRFADLLLSQTYGNFCGELRQTCTELAAIATIADVVPLESENRYFVKSGLASMPYTNCKALRAIIDSLGITEIDEKVVAFSISPMLNASGRLYDDGAYLPYNLLMCDDDYQVYPMVSKINDINKKRKEMVNSATDLAIKYIDDYAVYTENCIVLPMRICEGICGLVASKIVEKYKKPCFVLAETPEGCFKGSGRTFGETNVKDALDKVFANKPDCIATYGGHSGAAGLKVIDVSTFTEEINSVIEIKTEETDDYYDIVVTPNEVTILYEELKKFKPFGQGCPAPVIKIENFNALPSGSEFYSVMGDGTHLKLVGKGFKCVCFGLVPKYFSLGSPKCMDLYGTLNLSEFNGKKEISFEAVDFEKKEKDTKTSLALKIANKLKML